ncbi:MAG: MFS transporter [Steroidobacteraceae bacterium]
MSDAPTRRWLDLTSYQWLVLIAAWAGWGFDVFDALLFNFVAPNCIPALLQLPAGSPAAREATVFWTGLLSALLLVGWAGGGVLFGWVADRHGRQRALLITIALYALGTTLCAAATDITQLVVFRALASLGIGGEWAVGAILVAETVPESRRVEAGTLLQTASPLGIVLASVVNYQVAGVWFADQPQQSWRYVFLCGLAPVLLVLLIRSFVRESEHWRRQRSAPRASFAQLFAPGMRRATLCGFALSISGLLTWWACNAFLPLLGATLAGEYAAAHQLDATAARLLAESWKASASNAFNFGGLIGTFAAIPLAKLFGRRPMYMLYFGFSALALLAAFGLDISAPVRMKLLFGVGAGVYGIFSTYVFYLPELFPTRLRGIGSGFVYNVGRVVAAAGPLVVGAVAARAGGASAVLLDTLQWVALIPLAMLLLSPFIVIETRGRALPD